MTLPQAQRCARPDQRLALQANALQQAWQTIALQLLTESGVFEPATPPHGPGCRERLAAGSVGRRFCTDQAGTF